MGPPPPLVGNARVLQYAVLPRLVLGTGRPLHRFDGSAAPPAAALAICQYEDGAGYYLFGCDDTWQEHTDTWHLTVEDALAQAEAEYPGVAGYWRTPG
jgi:hypothetical protein